VTPVPEGYERVTTAAAITDTSPDTIYQWIRAGRLAYVQDRIYYVKVDEIAHCRTRDRLSRKVPPAPPEGMITLRRAQEMTGQNLRTLQHDCKTGKIVSAQKFGGMWYVDPGEVGRT